jgi:ribosomal protein S18 acetylase RimI-like enzyme
MTVECRLMRGDELEQVLDVWMAVYPETERERWRREFLSIPGSASHTYVAAGNGRVLSTALLWVREMNDLAGRGRRVGNVSHVATHPEARGRAHATRLLEMAMDTMQQEDCEFSTLFTSEEARPLYEKLSWRTCPLGFWQGRLVKVDLPTSDRYSIRSADLWSEPNLWERLLDIYVEFNANRPLAIRRDESTWKQFTMFKITDWVQAGASVWVASPTEAPQEICGYLLAHRTDEGFLVAEAGVRDGHRAALSSLLSPVIGSYGQGQGVGGRLYLPNKPDIVALLRSCFDPLMQVESDEMMIHAVDPTKDLSDFIASPSEETGMFWLLDQV